MVTLSSRESGENMSWDWFRFYANRISWKGSIAMGPVISKNFIMAQVRESFPSFYTSAFEWTNKASRNSNTVVKGKGGKKPAEREGTVIVMKDNKFILYCYITLCVNNIEICTWINIYTYLYFINTKYYRDNISLLCKSFTTPCTQKLLYFSFIYFSIFSFFMFIICSLEN